MASTTTWMGAFELAVMAAVKLQGIHTEAVKSDNALVDPKKRYRFYAFRMLMELKLYS